MKRRKPIACLLSACRRKTCGTRAAADGGTRLGGAESKRRRRSRLPAPPSRVTLLVQLVLAPPVHAVGERRLPRLVEEERPQDEKVHLGPHEAPVRGPRHGPDPPPPPP